MNDTTESELMVNDSPLGTISQLVDILLFDILWHLTKNSPPNGKLQFFPRAAFCELRLEVKKRSPIRTI